MSDNVHSPSVPRGALLGAAAFVLFSLAVATGARRQHLMTDGVATRPPPLESVVVRFEDRSDGTLAMLNDATGHDVHDVPPGTNGFIRGVLRGMFRGRKLESLGHDARFLLARDVDGRLTLEDPEIGRRVDLDSFGPTNSAAFAELLAAGLRDK